MFYDRQFMLLQMKSKRLSRVVATIHFSVMTAKSFSFVFYVSLDVQNDGYVPFLSRGILLRC